MYKMILWFKTVRTKTGGRLIHGGSRLVSVAPRWVRKAGVFLHTENDSKPPGWESRPLHTSDHDAHLPLEDPRRLLASSPLVLPARPAPQRQNGPLPVCLVGAMLCVRRVPAPPTKEGLLRPPPHGSPGLRQPATAWPRCVGVGLPRAHVHAFRPGERPPAARQAATCGLFCASSARRALSCHQGVRGPKELRQGAAAGPAGRGCVSPQEGVIF